MLGYHPTNEEKGLAVEAATMDFSMAEAWKQPEKVGINYEHCPSEPV